MPETILFLPFNVSSRILNNLSLQNLRKLKIRQIDPYLILAPYARHQISGFRFKFPSILFENQDLNHNSFVLGSAQ